MPWFIHVDQAAATIDFTQNVPSFRVGAGTGFTSGTSTLGYIVSGLNFDYIDVVMQGEVEGRGRVQYTATAIASNPTFNTSFTGSVLGGGWAGGQNGAFTKLERLDLQGPSNWQIVMTINIDFPGGEGPNNSASLGTIEHNAVLTPEPTTMAGLALGAVALIRRRRKK